MKLKKIGNSWFVRIPIDIAKPCIEQGEIEVFFEEPVFITHVPEKEVNLVTGEVYETKDDKLDGLRAMIENVNQKHETPLEPEARVETPQYPVPPKPGVILPAKRVVEYEEGEKVELIYEDNPL